MNKIFNLGSVDQYNKLYGLETLNPLVSVINLNKATRQMNYAHWHYGIYALYLKLEKACDIRYGRQNYDYQEGTIVCFAPGQDAETTLITDRVQVNALGILFHPDLLLLHHTLHCPYFHYLNCYYLNPPHMHQHSNPLQQYQFQTVN